MCKHRKDNENPFCLICQALDITDTEGRSIRPERETASPNEHRH